MQRHRRQLKRKMKAFLGKKRKSKTKSNRKVPRGAGGDSEGWIAIWNARAEGGLLAAIKQTQSQTSKVQVCRFWSVLGNKTAQSGPQILIEITSPDRRSVVGNYIGYRLEIEGVSRLIYRRGKLKIRLATRISEMDVLLSALMGAERWCWEI